MFAWMPELLNRPVEDDDRPISVINFVQNAYFSRKNLPGASCQRLIISKYRRQFPQISTNASFFERMPKFVYSLRYFWQLMSFFYGKFDYFGLALDV